MKALVVETPGKMAVHDGIPEPPLGDYDVHCEMLYGATCVGTDQHIFYGRLPWPVEYPTILGHESIGRAVKLGSKVRNFKEGDHITRVGLQDYDELPYTLTWGGFSEIGIARDHQAMREDGLPEEAWDRFRINKVIPPDIDPAVATMMITWRETLSYITRMGVGPGSTILILGSGGNGFAFASHARNLGAETIVMAGNPSRDETSKATGATHCVDYRVDALDEAVQTIVPDGYDFVIDVTGKTGEVDRVLSALKVGGMVGVYGLDDFDSAPINFRRAKGTFTIKGPDYDEPETHDQIIGYIRKGKLNAAHWLNLDAPFDFDDITSAYDAVREKTLVKAVVRIAQ
jgi:D-arabinose 1-dehydrogenase-like Zn-dependent alcohol dehydrogenase